MLAVTGAEYPDTDAQGRALPPLPGRSLLPLLRGEHRPLVEPLFFEHSGNLGVITEEWKLVAVRNKPWRLYHLPRDQLEQNDVAAENPGVVTAMAQQWQAWADENGARIGAWKWPLDRLNDNWQPLP